MNYCQKPACPGGPDFVDRRMEKDQGRDSRGTGAIRGFRSSGTNTHLKLVPRRPFSDPTGRDRHGPPPEKDQPRECH